MEKIIEWLKEKLDFCNSVVIFGSYARKENKKTSDLDVLVICDGTYNFKQIEEEFYKEFEIILSILDLTKEQFFEEINKGNPQLLPIFLEGIVVWDDGTFERGKNLFTALWGRENLEVRWRGKLWNTRMLLMQNYM